MRAPLTVIDASAIPRDRGGGGRYVDGLASELHGPTVIVCQARDRHIFSSLLPSARVIALSHRYESTAMRLFWEQFGLPRLARLGAHVEEVDPGFGDPLETFNTLWFAGAARLASAVSDEQRALLDPGLRCRLPWAISFLPPWGS